MANRLKLTIVISFVLLFCTKHNYHPRLIEYLKAEKDLRTRIAEEQGLEDSIKVLQQKYNIDLDEELAKLRENPEDWIEVLKELRESKIGK
jgi:hypothetical protein